MPPTPPTLRRVLSPARIRARVRELAGEIDRDYAGRDLLLIGVLKGAFVFLSDLMRALTVPAEVDFVHLGSYGAGTESSGRVILVKDTVTPVTGRDVLVVEDIVDTGLTLSWYLDLLRTRNPASIRICALLRKRERVRTPVPVDYLGFTVEKGFLVGYGLDHGERYRGLPGIHRLGEGR